MALSLVTTQREALVCRNVFLGLHIGESAHLSSLKGVGKAIDTSLAVGAGTDSAINGGPELQLSSFLEANCGNGILGLCCSHNALLSSQAAVVKLVASAK